MSSFNINSVACACCGALSKDGSPQHLEGALGLKMQILFNASSRTVDTGFPREAIEVRGGGDTIPGDGTTTFELIEGVVFEGALNEIGDFDWLRFNVTEAGQYSFELNGDATLNDTFLRLYDSAQLFIGFNDDGGPGLFSALTITLDVGLYFVEAASFLDSLAGNYTLLATQLIVDPDTIPADVTTAAVLSVGTTVTEQLQTLGDRDWFRFTATADGLYTFTMDGGGIAPLADTLLSLYDAAGNLILSNDDVNFFDLSSRIATTLTAGEYFVEAAASFDGAAGGYDLNVSFVDPGADTIADNPSTDQDIALGGSASSTLDFLGDRDWFRLTLEEDTLITVDLGGSGESPLVDTFLRIHDEDGNLIASNDDGGPGLFSQITGLAAAGTYYLSAGAFGDEEAGDYTISVVELDLATFDPLDAINWGNTRVDTGEGNVVEVYFAQAGEVFDGVTSSGWNAYEIRQARAAFANYERFLDVEFVIVDQAEGADFRLVTSPDIDALGYMYPPDAEFGDLQGIGVFNNAPGTGWASAPGGGLDQGGFGFITLIHEFGHGMGLAHPHDNGGGSEVLLGVTSAFGSFGFFDLNQGVYTTMSYNDGWSLAPFGQPTTPVFGYQGSIMAFDVALLQQRYGANTTTASGNSFYTLPSVNAQGTFYQTIWDTGGTDTIRHNGAETAVIDLRDATLSYEFGGGGFISYVDGIFGGFTIANGAVIERAQGGTGGDFIFGNAVGNRLDGRAGDDEISGGDGDDTVIGGDGADALFGEFGFDVITGGIGGDFIDGGEGNDTVNGQDDNDIVFGGNGDDMVSGANGDDLLDGGDGNDVVQGGEGNDTMNGGLGDDMHRGGNGADTFVFDGNDGGNDTVGDFRTGDVLQILGTEHGIVDIESLLGAATQVGRAVLIDFGGGNTVTLLNTRLATIDASDVIFDAVA